MILRAKGFEAWGRNFGPEMVFDIRRPGSASWETIVPKHPPAVASIV